MTYNRRSNTTSIGLIYAASTVGSASGSTASEQMFSTIDDKTIAEYSIYVFEGEEKYIPVTYKITEAYIAFKENEDFKKTVNHNG